MEQIKPVTTTLSKCYLFSALPSSDIMAMARVSSTIDYPRNTDIFAMGDEADGLRIILSGIVRIWISDADGHELTVTLLEAGDSFGEIALFDELPRTATATASEAAQCLFVPRAAVDTLLLQSPKFAKKVIQALCETLRRNTEEIGAVMFQGLDKRVSRKLCYLALSHATIENNTAQFMRKFSQGDLAKMLGVTREAMNKRMTVLTQEQLIETKGGYIKILDLIGLAERN